MSSTASWTPVVAILTAVVGGGCGWTATIHRAAAPALDTEIVDGDAEAVYVRSESGRMYRVPRREIADIDHPGNVVAIVGAVLVASGAAAYLAARDDNRDDAKAIGLVYGLPGAGMLVGGLIPWFRSRGAAGRYEQTRRNDVLTVLPADQVVPCAPGLSPPLPLTTTPPGSGMLRPIPPPSAPTGAPGSAAPGATPGQPTTEPSPAATPH